MVSASVLALWPGLSLSQTTAVVQTGAVSNAAGQTQTLLPTTTFVQSCNNGAGGIVGQGNCTLPTGGGSGGGAITAASGAYAAGALSIGAGVSGWDLSEGGLGDSAWTSGNGSQIAIEKALDRDILILNTNVQAAIPAGTNVIGALVANQTVQVTNTPSVTVNSGNISVPAVTVGGATPFHGTSTAGNNTTEVSTGAHTLYALTITGNNTAVGDVRLYDSASAPNCASATGVIHNWAIITTAGLESGLVVPIPAQGIKVANGLGYCITGADADNDNTNAPVGIHINGDYD